MKTGAENNEEKTIICMKCRRVLLIEDLSDNTGRDPKLEIRHCPICGEKPGIIPYADEYEKKVNRHLKWVA